MNIIIDLHIIIIIILKTIFHSKCHKVQLSDLYSACPKCPVGSYDFNQCMIPSQSNCIDTITPMKIVSQKSEKIKGVLSIRPAANVYGEDILHRPTMKSSVQIQEISGRSSSTILRSSRMTINVSLLNINILPVFEDVDRSSDNAFIFNSSPGSNIYHLKKPLMKITKNYCRHPIPSSYFITMTTHNNRHTKAKLYRCKKNRSSKMSSRCDETDLKEDSNYLRSVNDQCSHNKAMVLANETNSFYCLKNTNFINSVFKHYIRESISFHPDKVCDFARRKCNTCLTIKKKMCSKNSKSETKTPTKESCCSNKCLHNQNCEKLYSPRCYYLDRRMRGLDDTICMQGDTVKFTLTPQFDFSHNSFKCHIKKKHIHNIFKARIQIHIDNAFGEGKAWSPPPSEFNVPFTDPGSFAFGNIHISWASNLPTDDEMILHGFQKSKTTGQYFTVSKFNKNLSKELPKLQKHGDKSYIEIQFDKNVDLSTSNWNSLSCNINVSKIKSIESNSELDPVNIIPTEVIRVKDNSPFIYVFKSPNEDPDIEVELKEKSSILKSILCSDKYSTSGRIVSKNPKTPFSIQLSPHKWPSQWNLLVEGFVSDDSTFVNIKIKDISRDILLTDYDQVVFNQFNKRYHSSVGRKKTINSDQRAPIEFATYFLLHLFPSNLNLYQYPRVSLNVEIGDCYSSYSKTIYHFPTDQFSNKSTSTKDRNEKRSFPKLPSGSYSSQLSTQIAMYHSLLQYFAILTFVFCILYSFIILLLIFIKVCSKTDQKLLIKRIQANLRKTYLNQRIPIISKRRRFFLFLFVTFKVFYNFVFTLSVGLSLILSLESNFSPFEITPSRLLNGIQIEVRKMDNYCSEELQRQNDFMTKMNIACTDKRSLCQNAITGYIMQNFNLSLDAWLLSKNASLYGSISNSFTKRFNENFKLFYNHSERSIMESVDTNKNQYHLYLSQFEKSIYYRPSREFFKDHRTQRLINLSYESHFVSRHSFKSQPFPDMFEPVSMSHSHTLYVDTWFQLGSSRSLKKLSTYLIRFSSTMKSKLIRYFQSSTFKHNLNKQRKVTENIGTRSQWYDKRQLEMVMKSRRYQLHVSLWNIRLMIVFIDIIVITYRFYQTLMTIKIIWLGSHVYLSINRSKGVISSNRSDNTISVQALQNVKLKNFIHTNPSCEMSALELSMSKFICYLHSCKGLYYICIVITFVFLIGIISIFVVGSFCIGRANFYISTSSVAESNLQYMSRKVNWIINRQSKRFNNERLTSAHLLDYQSRIRLIWMKQYFRHEDIQIYQSIQHQICSLISYNSLYQSLRRFCEHHDNSKGVHCSLQPCHFINVKSLNYSESYLIKELQSLGPVATSLILIPFMRFTAVAILVVIAILLMIGIIYHSSKLLSKIFLTYSDPINATIINRNLPLLSKSVIKQHFIHSSRKSQCSNNERLNSRLSPHQTKSVFAQSTSNCDLSARGALTSASRKHSESTV